MHKTSRSILVGAFAATLIGALGACSTTPDGQAGSKAGSPSGQAAVPGETVDPKAGQAQLAELYLPTIRLSVAETQVIPAFASPRRSPHVEHTMKVPLLDLATAWARSNVKAAGNRNRATIVIDQAMIVEAGVGERKGVGGLFQRTPDRRFDALLRMTLQIRDERTDKVIANASAVATRQTELFAGADESERQAILKKMSEALVSAAAKELDKQIKTKLTAFAK